MQLRAPVGAGLAFAFGTGFYAVCRATSATADNDFFDSRLWAWGWMVLPVVAIALAGLTGHAAIVSTGLVAPQAVGVVVEGLILFDHSADVSFWPVGLMIVFVLFGWTSAAALVGRSLSSRLRPVHEGRVN